MSDRAVLPAQKFLPEESRFSKATQRDLPAVRTLLRSCDLPVEDLTPEHLGHFVLCHVRDRLVGSVGLEVVSEGAALLRSLAVAPEERARGVGRELWTRAQEQARTLAVRRLYLLTTTAESLFWQMGVSAAAQKRGFRRDPSDGRVQLSLLSDGGRHGVRPQVVSWLRALISMLTSCLIIGSIPFHCSPRLRAQRRRTARLLHRDPGY